ncbi:MAG: hypothetical protein N5P05_003265 [Chroococcopsis gigantea SAG 12.99]|nr:hypothetical protein [Chroococcopsis gigantea SAG 12.99]
MVLKPWQLTILIAPIALIVLFLLVAAGLQIHQWGINWIWAIVTLILVGWRFLLVKWIRPPSSPLETVVGEIVAETDTNFDKTNAQLETILKAAENDPPIWENPGLFWQRCQDLVTAIANTYYPEVKYPLLNIYIPQAYGLIRGTVEDTDRWMQNLSPVLNQMTIGQARQSYETYQKLEPSMRRIWQVWNSAQWILNPASAAARVASQRYSDKATQQLLFNLGRLLRETALKNLCRQAILLYSGKMAPPTPSLPLGKTGTLQEIIVKAEPVSSVEQKPVNILLVGRTGAGKSSLINTLFASPRAAVDVLPSTSEIQSYQWNSDDGDTLTLWDSPGYEQAQRSDLRSLVLDYAQKADVLLLATPALDPSLQMDLDFLQDVQENIDNLPVIVCVTGVDRLRPFKEWQPPYDWINGARSKEVSIREATEYRSQLLGDYCDRIYPIVTEDKEQGRSSWGIDPLASSLVDSIEPAKQGRLCRFLRDRDARIIAAGRIIDRYTFQLTTTAGVTALLKSPILSFISTLTTGSPGLAYLLAQQIPVEQLPLVIGKLQMAYDLFKIFNTNNDKVFDFQSLWPLLLNNPDPADKNAAAFGHALVEYWTQSLTIEQLESRYEHYLNNYQAK